MSSARRIQSSRANGAKSRGPKTPASKARSAANSLRHGLLARKVVLEDDEKVGAFVELLTAFQRDLDPQNEIERALVEDMAVARWRLIRIWALEKTTLQREMHKHDPAANDPLTRAALAFRTPSDGSRTLDLLSRYESRYSRQFARFLKLLLKARQASGPVLSAANEICQTTPVPKPDTSFSPPPTPAPTKEAPESSASQRLSVEELLSSPVAPRGLADPREPHTIAISRSQSWAA